MSMNIFISSEMASDEDKKRRAAAIKEVSELGHQPMYFEGLPARPFPDTQNAEDKCRELVRTSDIMLFIVDDTESIGMGWEIDEALKAFGNKKIMYYFTTKGNRDQKAIQLWNSAKDGYKCGEFQNASELRKQIKKTIGSYLEDALKKKGQSEILLDKEYVLPPNGEEHIRFSCDVGDSIIITCLGDRSFYTGFFIRTDFIALRKKVEGMFGFKYGDDREQFTFKVPISINDDYYLVLRRTIHSEYSAKIQVRVKREKNG